MYPCATGSNGSMSALRAQIVTNKQHFRALTAPVATSASLRLSPNRGPSTASPFASKVDFPSAALQLHRQPGVAHRSRPRREQVHRRHAETHRRRVLRGRNAARFCSSTMPTRCLASAAKYALRTTATRASKFRSCCSGSSPATAWRFSPRMRDRISGLCFPRSTP